MKIAGIIAEYNPFHKGHEYHIRETRKFSDAVVCVMSGNFTQRGDAAIFEKSIRAECAADSGADLVVELPLPWAMAPAETFARGAVGILAGLGTEILSFGSESGDLSPLESAVFWGDNPQIRPRLRELLNEGMTFAAARELAVREKSLAAADTLRRPNDTLAVEYLREIRRQNASLQPVAILRRGAAHDSDIVGEFASASAIREMLFKGDSAAYQHMPESCAEVLIREVESGRGPVFLTESNYNVNSGPIFPGLERAILSRLRMLSREALGELPDISEGLENRLYEALRKGRSWREICEFAKTKRYTMARIRRLFLSAALGVTKLHCKGIPPYAKVLSMSKRGEDILRTSSENPLLPVITRTSQIKGLDKRARMIYDLECAAGDLYSLGFPSPAPCGVNQRSRIYILNR